VRHELDAGGAQRVGRFAVTAVSNAHPSLHGVAAPHEARQRAHAAPPTPEKCSALDSL